ncbi:MAG: hypothetical protein IIA88_04660 [Bacteroidetes bacterium]|nr:hypothetical protein [Bacteroidota bacterium]
MPKVPKILGILGILGISSVGRALGAGYLILDVGYWSYGWPSSDDSLG